MGVKQIARLESIRASRDPQAAEASLAAIQESAKSGEGNLLELAISAARARCTVGEITRAMEAVYGRHVASDKMVTSGHCSRPLRKLLSRLLTVMYMLLEFPLS